MILVDTSVWIDHLHATETRLGELLGLDEVGSHPMVIEELALGSIKNRPAVLDSLGSLRSFPVASHAEVMSLVEVRRLWGRGLSAVDVQVLASTMLQPGSLLWTRDKRLRSAAAAAGAAIVGWR